MSEKVNLTVVSDKTRLLTNPLGTIILSGARKDAMNGADRISFTCADPLIAGDNWLDVRVWLNDDLGKHSARIPVVAGYARFQLMVATQGLYLVSVARVGVENPETKVIEIEAIDGPP